MERITDGAALSTELRGGIVALGNFDGFHRGHQAVVGRALDVAGRQRRPALVATFDPHPARLFKPELPPFALTTVTQRLALFEVFGMDASIVIPFSHDLAALSAEAFVTEWLVGRMGVAGVVTGGDFTFGKGRSGDTATLADFGRKHGFSAEVVAPVADARGTISSSRVRHCLRTGDPHGAATLLTRPFTIRSIVEHGAKLGRQLGFPTANLRLGDYQRPAYGVYAVMVRLRSGAVVPGVANIGIRPMIVPAVELLEVWLLNWEGDLYSQDIAVELRHYLRPEAKFDGLEALKLQVYADADAARAALSR